MGDKVWRYASMDIIPRCLPGRTGTVLLQVTSSAYTSRYVCVPYYIRRMLQGPPLVLSTHCRIIFFSPTSTEASTHLQERACLHCALQPILYLEDPSGPNLRMLPLVLLPCNSPLYQVLLVLHLIAVLVAGRRWALIKLDPRTLPG